jgi:hypothetical protein
MTSPSEARIRKRRRQEDSELEGTSAARIGASSSEARKQHVEPVKGRTRVVCAAG